MITGQAVADIDIDAATALYQHQCQTCHGPEGQASAPFLPKLAGQHASYLQKALRDYQQGSAGPRPDPIMLGFAQGLSPTEINNLTAYLSTQTATYGTVEQRYLILGQKLYRAGDRQRHIPACAACHGPAGNGNSEAAYPKLAGQSSAYLVKQLQLFSNDSRHSDPNGMMRAIAKRLSPQDQLAVASFINGLQPTHL